MPRWWEWFGHIRNMQMRQNLSDLWAFHGINIQSDQLWNSLQKQLPRFWSINLLFLCRQTGYRISLSFLHVTYYVNICRFGGQWPICNPDSIKFPLQDCSFWYFIMGWSWFCPKKCRQESLIRAKVDAQRMQETLGAGSWALFLLTPFSTWPIVIPKKRPFKWKTSEKR